jgi:crotonobetainyl-CoA:carnitine CoA-transferase CaiB-like acyl-CoA transferase
MQAEAGFLHLTGEPGSAPARMGLSIIDYMTGITTALGILAALVGVARDGQGRDVDVSLFDVALHQLTYPGNWYLNEGMSEEQINALRASAQELIQSYQVAEESGAKAKVQDSSADIPRGSSTDDSRSGMSLRDLVDRRRA